MIDIKVIKNENEYETALRRVEELIDIEHPSTGVLDEMELLSLLIEQYEKTHYPIDPPDPIEYIEFKMDQEGLTNKDMVKYIGSLSKVSEVLSYKVKLSLPMIQNLNEGLAIPLDILSKKYEKKNIKGKYPESYYKCFNELVKRNYFPNFSGTLTEAKKQIDDLLDSLINGYSIGEQIFCRKTGNIEIDTFALFAWQCKIRSILEKEKIKTYSLEELPKSFMRDVAELSYYTDGCKFVKEHLNKFGIHFIVLRHLPKTNLDGAVFMFNGHPVVALTLRHDREDNFWFTLLHELAHVQHHLKDENHSFFDDTDSKLDEKTGVESEANRFAEEALIPRDLWNKKKCIKSVDDIYKLSNELKINPAIIAGKIRFKKNNYSLFGEIIFKGSLREKLIPKQNDHKSCISHYR